MKVEQRTVYISDDGSEYDSEEGCRNRDKVLKLRDYIYKNLYYEMTYDEAADYIIEHWVNIEKIVND